MQFVDIHTHKKITEKDVLTVRNLSPREVEEIPTGGNAFFSVGIHPWDVEVSSEETLKILNEKAFAKSVKLIGECGLDKNIPTAFEKQLYFFKTQIALSEKSGKPLIIHCVGYFNELIALRKELKPLQRWIVHGFRGKPPLARQILHAGMDLSFGEKLNPESVRITPLENLFVETDESDKSVIEIYASIAEIKNCAKKDITAGFLLVLR